jgi:hypothetical protein
MVWSIMSGRWDSGCNIKDVRKPSQSNQPDFLKRWSVEGDFLQDGLGKKVETSTHKDRGTWIARTVDGSLWEFD